MPRRFDLLAAFLFILVFTSAAAFGMSVPYSGRSASTTATQGIRIDSVPEEAEVFLDGGEAGRTPLVIADVAMGIHTLILHKDGYFDLPIVTDYQGSLISYRVPLMRIIGLLQVSVSPPAASLFVAGRHVTAGIVPLPTGSYDVMADAFGYDDFHTRVDVSSQALMDLKIALSPAAFDFSNVSLSSRVVNPDLWGIFGTLNISFDVTAAGTGELGVVDFRSQEVFHAVLPPFTSRGQSYRWNLRDSSGAPLPDGRYRLILKGMGTAGNQQVEEDVDFTVKR